MPDPLPQLVDTFYRAFSGDTDLLDAVVAPDWEDIPLSPGQEHGPDGIKPVINGIGQSFTDFHIVVHDVIDGRGADGNGNIGVRAEMRGTHRRHVRDPRHGPDGHHRDPRVPRRAGGPPGPDLAPRRLVRLR